MKNAILFILCFSFFGAESNAQTINASIMHDGVQRNYVLYIPTNYTGNAAVPLILNFHGFGGSGLQQMGNSNFKPIADTAGFIMVHPTGTPLGGLFNHWNVGGWTNTSTTDDIGFASALIDTLAANYNIDLQKVFATGFSNGGFFSHRLACELGPRIAAIASVSGTFTPQMQTACAPTHPTPILQIHGTNDATVPYNGTSGNGGMAAVDTVIEYWVAANNCNTTPAITALPDINTTDGSTVEHIVYPGGNAGVNVELFKITNGGHDWPGTSGNMDINASLEIWKFFSKYSNTAVKTETISKAIFNVYPNPATEEVNFQSSDDILAVNVFDQTGRQVLHKAAIKKQKMQISLAGLSKGIYFYTIQSDAGFAQGKLLKK